MDPHDITVLIGEDDPGLALEMQRQLLILGYQVQIRAGTPHEIVVLATELKPDLMILDLDIGGDNHGVEVARAIHDVTTIPTVFLAAFSEDMWKNAHALPRPFRHVTKPIAIEDVHSAIQDLLP